MGIEDANELQLNQSGLACMFIAANFEEDDALSTQEDENNDDNSLMRFEWMEILIRVAIMKYMHGSIAATVSEAIELLLRKHLDMLPPEAIVDPNRFRENRLYSEKMNHLLLVR